MALCIENSAGQLAVVTPQPTDLTTCQFLLLAPSEVSGATAAFNTAEASGFFMFGFSCIMISYLAAYAVGSHLKALRQARN